MGEARLRDRGYVLAFLAALAAITGLAGTLPAAADTIIYGITSATALSLPHYIAQEKQFYAAEHLTVEAYVVGAASGVLQQLAGGSLNMAQAATDQTLRAIRRGAPVRIVAGATSNAPFRMLAAKGVTGWSALKGRTVSVGGLTDVTLYFLRLMARRNGLADQDYDLVYGGGSPNRLAQLVSGAVAGAILTNPQDFAALEQGFVDLGRVAQYVPHWSQNNLLVDTRWAARHRAAVVGFLRAHIRATRFFYDPANRDAVTAALAKYTRATPQISAATYDLYLQDRVIAPEAALYEDGIRANLEAFVAMGEMAQAPPLAGFIDASFLGEATGPAREPGP